MSKPKTLSIDGVDYIREDSVQGLSPIETSHIIVIAQRGFIFIGHQNLGVSDKVQLLNASIVRKWTNGRGIGGLVKEAHKDEYTLDPVGQVEFSPEGIIATLKVEY